MEVILLEDVKALGKKGEVVKVSDGYAKNFILKKKLGVEANGPLDRQKIMPSSSLCSHALVLDAQGFGAFGNTKANRHKIKNEPGGNDRSP